MEYRSETTFRRLWNAVYNGFFSLYRTTHGLTLFGLALTTIGTLFVLTVPENAELAKDQTEMDHFHSDRDVSNKLAVEISGLCDRFEALRKEHRELHTNDSQRFEDWLGRVSVISRETSQVLTAFKVFRSKLDNFGFESKEAKTLHEFQKQHSDWHLQRLGLFQQQQADWIGSRQPDSVGAKEANLSEDKVEMEREEVKKTEYKRQLFNWNREHRSHAAWLSSRRSSLELRDLAASISFLYVAIFSLSAFVGFVRWLNASPGSEHR